MAIPLHLLEKVREIFKNGKSSDDKILAEAILEIDKDHKQLISSFTELANVLRKEGKPRA